MGLILKIIPPILLLMGLVGNSLVIVTWSRVAFIKLRVSWIFRIEAIFEMLSIIQIIPTISEYTFGYNLYQISSFSCKLLRYFEYAIPAMSSHMLVIISLDRVCSIIFTQNNIFKKFYFRIVLGVIVYNLIVYVMFSIGFEISYDTTGKFFIQFPLQIT